MLYSAIYQQILFFQCFHHEIFSQKISHSQGTTSAEEAKASAAFFGFLQHTPGESLNEVVAGISRSGRVPARMHANINQLSRSLQRIFERGSISTGRTTELMPAAAARNSSELTSSQGSDAEEVLPEGEPLRREFSLGEEENSGSHEKSTTSASASLPAGPRSRAVVSQGEIVSWLATLMANIATHEDTGEASGDTGYQAALLGLSSNRLSTISVLNLIESALEES